LNGFEGVNGSVDAGFRTVKLSTWTSISPVEPWKTEGMRRENLWKKRGAYLASCILGPGQNGALDEDGRLEGDICEVGESLGVSEDELGRAMWVLEGEKGHALALAW
jgi:hypothetical protein